MLIDPGVEAQWLEFERRTGHPTLVMWKFAPTNDAELIAWYRRMQRRQAVFDQGCGVDIGAVQPVLLLGDRAPTCWNLPVPSGFASGRGCC